MHFDAEESNGGLMPYHIYEDPHVENARFRLHYGGGWFA